MGNGTKRSTIKDVARAAEVNISTVSRVLGGNPAISPATKARVLRAVENLNYLPDSAARAMVTKRTRAFALLVPNLADPNVAAIAAGAERQARRANYVMFLAGYDVKDEGYKSSFYAEHRVDGLMLMSPRYFNEAKPPLPTATLEEAPVDNVRGGRIVAAHLRALGHQQVAFVGGFEESRHSHERLNGFRSEGDLRVTAAFGDWTTACGFALAERVLANHREVTALFAASDAVALGVLHAVQASGKRVPADMSVVGFDDIAPARYYWPALTTVAQPLEAVGAAAFDLLLARIEGRPEPELGPKAVALCVRASTGPAPRGGRP